MRFAHLMSCIPTMSNSSSGATPANSADPGFRMRPRVTLSAWTCSTRRRRAASLSPRTRGRCSRSGRKLNSLAAHRVRRSATPSTARRPVPTMGPSTGNRSTSPVSQQFRQSRSRRAVGPEVPLRKPLTLSTRSRSRSRHSTSATASPATRCDFGTSPKLRDQEPCSWFLIGGATRSSCGRRRKEPTRSDSRGIRPDRNSPSGPLHAAAARFQYRRGGSENERNFINFVREKITQRAPWLYAEWVERDRRRPSDRGSVPSIR